ncbi:MAG TPA: peptidoglycan binding domain-containing protein, partial [Chloroflexota bacterium]|nr:peptidoglycan binding domain-containing protein [Chloroflexota bacterium]
MAVRTRLLLSAALAADAPPAPFARPRFPLRLLAVLAILPLLMVSSILVTYQQQHTDRIYTGVRVLGLDLSRMTREEATGAMKRHLTEISRRPLHLRYDAEAITVSLTAAGLVFEDADIALLADHAWMIGREPELRTWLRGQIDLFRDGYDLPVQGRLDHERTRSLLGRVAFDVERVTVNASMSVERAGDRFEVHTSPAFTGRNLNVEATIAQLQEQLKESLPQAVDLVLDEVPPSLTDEHLVPAITAVETLLGSPLEFKDGARVWRLDPGQAYEMLEISGLSEATPPVKAKLNDEKFAAFVEKIAREADTPAVNPSFAVENDFVVVQPGRPGKVADAQATLDRAKERALATGTPRSVDIVFKEDQPWLTAADLEPARARANALLSAPIVLESPDLPGITPMKWELTRPQLAQMLVLPSTLGVPRDFATLPLAARPRFDVQLDSGRVTNFLAREVAPWVSQDPTDAELQLMTTRIEVPNPAYQAAIEAARGIPPAGENADAPAAGARPATSVAPTSVEARQTVGLRNARDGRGPDYQATFAALQTVFQSEPQAVAPERRLTVRLASRPPTVRDVDLAPARDQANQLIGEPIILRWKDRSWTVTRDELVAMLRYQQDRNGRQSAYLSRDGLIAKAQAVAREAERSPDA